MAAAADPENARQSLCLAGKTPGLAVHHDDATFPALVSSHFDDRENDAAERLVALKRTMRSIGTTLTWEKLLEELAGLGQAQCAFVVRRLHPISERAEDGHVDEDIEGSGDELAMACYYDDGHGKNGWLRDHTYSATNTPCEQMKHGKVFLIPGHLKSCAVSDHFPFDADAYIATPLWFGHRNVGHLGMVWSADGLAQKSLSWSYIEMLLHSLEDMVAQRVLDDNASSSAFSKPENQLTQITLPTPTFSKPQPATAPSSPIFAHPLKPFAPSLSHELRTPMQGVVGMLDVMHASVQEAIDEGVMSKAAPLLQDLKGNIELVQDSARRAVEAADNVVHAYDLNMEVPETPHKEVYAGIMGDVLCADSMSLPDTSLPQNPYKRRRSFSVEWPSHGRAPKRSYRRNASHGDLSPRSEVKNAIQESDKIVYSPTKDRIEEVVVNAVSQRPSLAARRLAPQVLLEGVPSTAVRHTKIRELLHLVINESLHIGKRPESTRSEKTPLGERIDVHALAPNGETCVKNIEWSVEANVPETLFVDERDLAKLISCVFLNAVKFTERGGIGVSATLSSKPPQHIRLNIRDTGTGIPEEFFPSLFKPFSREDDSTTRTRDGLGLGLLVAKGLARKMGGDLLCVHSSTSGPERGSEFEIRIPVNPSGTLTRPGTPQTVSTPTLPTPLPTAHPSDLKSPTTPPLAVEPGAVDPADDVGVAPAGPVNNASVHSVPPASDDHVPPPRPLLRPLSLSPSNAISQPHSKLKRSSIVQENPLTFLVAEDNQINRKILVNMLRKLGYRDIYEAYDGQQAVRIMEKKLLSSYPLPSPESSPSLQGSDSGLDSPPLEGNCSDTRQRRRSRPIDVVLMDLWMPVMDGYEATSQIFQLVDKHCNRLRLPKPNNQGGDSNWAIHENENFSSSSSSSSASSSSSSSSMSLSVSAADISPKVLAVSADVTDEALNRASKVGIQGYMMKPYKLADLERLIADCCTSVTVA